MQSLMPRQHTALGSIPIRPTVRQHTELYPIPIHPGRCRLATALVHQRLQHHITNWEP